MLPDAVAPAFGLFPMTFRAISPALRGLQAEPPHAFPAFVEDQPVKVVGQIAEGQPRFGMGQADGADEKPEPVLLMSEDMFDKGPESGIWQRWPSRSPSLSVFRCLGAGTSDASTICLDIGT